VTWKIRHQGSPQHVELSLEQVVEGLQDGLWEPTDEIMGPADRHWVALESHPQLAALVADLESPAPRVEEDETRLDMNALIDVCLVLLIFFILTMSYQALEKILDMPASRAQNPQASPRVVPPEQVQTRMVRVEARQHEGRAAITVEGQPVEEADLVRALRQQRKNELLLYTEGQVDWGTVVRIISAAGRARIEKVHFEVRTPPPSG
jgi:biopolymer transport protein ExbD